LLNSEWLRPFDWLSFTIEFTTGTVFLTCPRLWEMAEYPVDFKVFEPIHMVVEFFIGEFELTLDASKDGEGGNAFCFESFNCCCYKSHSWFLLFTMHKIPQMGLHCQAKTDYSVIPKLYLSFKYERIFNWLDGVRNSLNSITSAKSPPQKYDV